jgi:lysophospholipase L1-like esterase
MLALAALAGQPARAEGVSDGECPKTVSALKGQELLRLMDDKAADGLQILAIGSSSTEGVGASSPANSYPSQLEATLRRVFPEADIAVQNAGIGGETADRTVARLEETLRVLNKPDLVIWQVGTNDAVRGGNEDEFRVLLERGVAAVRRAEAKLILLDQQFYPTIPDVERYERYVAIVGMVADQSGVGAFSRYQMMRSWDRHPGVLTSMLSKDRFHMGDQGYRCLAQALGHGIASAVNGPLTRSILVARSKRVVPGSSSSTRRS